MDIVGFNATNRDRLEGALRRLICDRTQETVNEYLLGRSLRCPRERHNGQERHDGSELAQTNHGYFQVLQSMCLG